MSSRGMDRERLEYTPESLTEAITLALTEGESPIGMMPAEAKGLADYLAPHILDFLAKRFSGPLLDKYGSEDQKILVAVQALWDLIQKESG